MGFATPPGVTYEAEAGGRCARREGFRCHVFELLRTGGRGRRVRIGIGKHRGYADVYERRGERSKPGNPHDLLPAVRPHADSGNHHREWHGDHGDLPRAPSRRRPGAVGPDCSGRANWYRVNYRFTEQLFLIPDNRPDHRPVTRRRSGVLRQLAASRSGTFNAMLSFWLLREWRSRHTIQAAVASQIDESPNVLRPEGASVPERSAIPRRLATKQDLSGNVLWAVGDP